MNAWNLVVEASVVAVNGDTRCQEYFRTNSGIEMAQRVRGYRPGGRGQGGGSGEGRLLPEPAGSGA